MRRWFPTEFAILSLIALTALAAPLRAGPAGDGNSTTDTDELYGNGPGLNPPPKIAPRKTWDVIVSFRKENINGYQQGFLAGETLTYDLLINARVRAQGTVTVDRDRDEVLIKVPGEIIPDNVRIVADGMTTDYFGTETTTSGNLSGGFQNLDIYVNVTMKPKN